MSVQFQPATLADDLHRWLAEIFDRLETAACYLGDVRDAVDGARASRLARRRRSSVITDVAPVLELFDWFLSEGLGQVDELTYALDTLLEPPHSARTRYGRKTGVFATAPYDWSRCGTPAAYQAHRRRGQDCRACRKAVARYNADRKALRIGRGVEPLFPNTIRSESHD